MTELYGLTGLAGVGKDAACEQLKELHGEIFSFAFAEPLKQGAAVLFGVDVKHFYRNKQDVCPIWGITYRTMLQKLGTEFAREMISNEFWLRRADQTYKNLLECSPEFVVCTDVRFDNEARWVHGHGGKIIQIQRDTALLEGEEQGHTSEQGVDASYIDYIVENNGTFDDLKENLLFTV